MDDLRALMLRVESLRLQLNEAAANRSLDDPGILEASRMLDLLLNEYHRLLKERLERG